MKKLLLLSVLMCAMCAQAQTDTTKVYVTQFGKTYHTNKACRYIKGKENVKRITLKSALQGEKRECKVCCKSREEKSHESKENQPKTSAH